MRADAIRNRDAVLAAAGQLFDAAQHPDQVSMDDIAAAARVGKGTLFRRFGDRAGLLQALYEQRAQRLHAMLQAAPANPARARVLELLSATLDFKIQNRALAGALERTTFGSPYRNESYHHLHQVLADLITEVRGAQAADYLAHALLAAMRSDLVEHLHDWPADRLQAGLTTLVDAVLGTPHHPAAPVSPRASPAVVSTLADTPTIPDPGHPIADRLHNEPGLAH